MRSASVAFVALALLSPFAAAQEKEAPWSKEALRARDQVVRFLQEKKGDYAQILLRRDPALERMFPKHVFLVARYRQFPVARVLPEGLQASNVFAVDDDKALLLPNARGLADFFRKHLPPIEKEEQSAAALTAWLDLAQEFHQDGFFRFEILRKEFSSEKGTVKGRAIVVQGGNGELGGVLTFREGKLQGAREFGKIQPGPRPICQATLLLHADPLVRRIAEADLLIMGRAARDYLMEQRDRADADLRAAIDRLWRRIQDNDR